MCNIKEKENVINEQYLKNNILISATYKSTLLENKIMAIALANIKNAAKEENGKVVSRLSASEIKKMINGNSGSFYYQLEKASQRLAGKTIGMSDPEKGYFDYLAIITRCTYENGELRIEWNDALKSRLVELSSNFTVLNISTMLSFENVYSFRLYELLKSNAYTHKYQTEENKKHIIEYSLSELKLNLGIVNAELDSVRDVLYTKKTPDFDKAVAASPERMFEDWRDLRRKVIEVAISEINEKTDLEVEYEPIKHGKGAKVTGINFFVSYKEYKKKDDKSTREAEIIETADISKDSETLTDDEKFNILAQAKLLLSNENVSLTDVVSICEAAGYDLEKIKNAYEASKAAKSIKTFTGFMVAGVKTGYSAPKAKKTNEPQYKQFEQREYDFNELEQELLSK